MTSDQPHDFNDLGSFDLGTQGPPYSDDQLLAVLQSVSKIAVVGASANPEKPAHRIPQILIDAGFDVIPVNPTAKELFGLVTYPSLADIPQDVDLVDVFRPSDELPEIAHHAVKIGARGMWAQLGLRSIEARQIAQDGGLFYLEDVCIGAEVRRLGFRK